MVWTALEIGQAAASRKKTKIWNPQVKRLTAVLLFLYAAATATITLAAPISVLTYHNDNGRTGRNTNETVLTLANVNTNSFGKLFAYAVDGYVYAQPLVLTNVTTPSNGVHNVVYVATEHDSVYAFDADSNTGSNAGPLWQVSFINPSAGITSVPSDDLGCSDLVPEIGITSTPVIDPASGTIYVEAKTKEIVSGVVNYVQRLHALDVATGAEKFGGPVLIQASVPGTGDGNDGLGHVPFDPLTQFNRTALLLNNGVVYFGCASHCDVGPYHGWLFGYNAHTLATNGVFNTTPNGGLGGIWEAGCGPASDANGNVYVSTGNGTFDPTNGNYGDSFLRLSGNSLILADYFTPFNQQVLDSQDLDLDSGGNVVLPDEVGSVAHPHLVVGAGKEGTVYLVDRDDMGHFNAAGDTQIVQSLPSVIGGSFDTPAYFNNTLYFVGVNDVIRAFTITDASIVSIPASQGSTAYGFPGATPSVSANGTNDGIVWAIQSDAYVTSGPAVLHAYNAADVSQELYNSSQAGSRDIPGGAVKFTVPVIANGKVYVGTESSVAVFGYGTSLTTPTILPNGGIFSNSVTVSLADASPGTVIYYTVDGTDPTTNSLLYTGSFSVTNSAVVSARAFEAGQVASAAASAGFTNTVGAKNLPLGDWEVTISGADRGVAFLTFNDDFSASGHGIRLKIFGLDDVSGHWAFDAKGRVTGPFLERTGGTMNWSGTLLGTVKSLKRVSGTVPTTAFGTFHWRGVPATTGPDLSATWTGLVTVAKTPTSVSYVIRTDTNAAAVFDIATSADPGTVVGQLVATSRNRVYGYLTFDGRQVTMSGSYNSRKLTMSFNGMSNTGEKVKVRLTQ